MQTASRAPAATPYPLTHAAASARVWPASLLLTLSLLGSPAPANAGSADLVAPYTAEGFLSHVRVLADDAMRGRRPGDDSIEKAAEYIASQFEKAGLEKAGENDSWFQSFEFTRGKALVAADAEFRVNGHERQWRVGKDWTPLPFSAIDDVSGPLAFAGFGIKADEYGWNDYTDFDINGKLLLIFRYEPAADDPDADFGGKQPSSYAEFRSKAYTASQRGAKALLIVNPPQREPGSDALFTFDESLTLRTFDIPMVHVSAELAQALLAAGGVEDSLASLQKALEKDRKPLSRDLSASVSIKTGLKPLVIRTRNVLGLLKGEDGASETIVVGAHYDHLGVVPRQFERANDQSFIHNGADDNASGTSAVIELARGLAKEGKLRRNVLFAAFSAEELGLYGSRAFVRKPTVPLSAVKAMINFDMVGRLDLDSFTVFGVPSAAEFAPLVDREAKRLGLEYRAPKSLVGNSDHAAFLAEEIPYLFPFTGMHSQYHRPEDDVELIDGEGGAKVVRMFDGIIRELATCEHAPAFTQPSDDVDPNEAPPAPAFGDPNAQPATTRTNTRDEVGATEMPRARLGIIPDYTADGKPGVVVATVVDGGAARAAGIRDGDRIIRIGDRDIKDIYGYMDAMKGRKPDESVEVRVARGADELTLTVKLLAARGGARRQ